MMVPSFIPRCPNHHEPLEGLPFPMTETGTGMCPVSGCSFDYEVRLDDNEMVQDKDGNLTKKPKWEVRGEEK